MKISWDKIRIFYYVCQELSFTKVASKLNVTTPAVSASILTLEKQLGFKLFFRKGRILQLTEEGEICYRVAEKMAENFSSLSSLLADKKASPRGNIRVVTSVVLSTMWFPHYIPGFVKQYPHVKLSLTGSDDKVDFVNSEIDLAISTGIPYRNFLIQDYLMTFHLGLYASPEYLEKFGTPKKLEDLKHHHLLSYNNDSLHQFGKGINKILQTNQARRPLNEAFMEINMGISLVAVASQGLGIVSLSEEYPGLKESGLVNILPEVQSKVKIYCIYRKQMKDSKKIMVFTDYLKKAVGSRERLSA